ncbi:pre-mRNA-splicing factor 38B isoform X1 [Bemisia tabaci]|uniref:pre-mRNA-splicing factor 38B isoform X1 n=1 Tax=Bemisia tabaci TaxID=7038 RepID=UPI003B27E06B
MMKNSEHHQNEAGGHDEDEEENHGCSAGYKKNNVLPLWGNERTMNLNPLILTNIQSSHYFKVNLYELKTYHEVIDEIYYKVAHLEPWEKGSRKTAGQTGMCGGVRGVGAGGIVSTAYCLLYKLFTLKLTRKQVNGLITHPDSPYIRALGFMYIRYTQPPADLWDWYDEYLEDPEEMDVKAGGGLTMNIGNILRSFLCKLEWFSTLFPRIPVPIQQKIERKMNERFPNGKLGITAVPRPIPEEPVNARHIPDKEAHYGEAERYSRGRGDSASKEKYGESSHRERSYHSRERDSRRSSRDREHKRSSHKERRDWSPGHDDRRKYKEDDLDRRRKYDGEKRRHSRDRDVDRKRIYREENYDRHRRSREKDSYRRDRSDYRRDDRDRYVKSGHDDRFYR